MQTSDIGGGGGKGVSHCASSIRPGLLDTPPPSPHTQGCPYPPPPGLPQSPLNGAENLSLLQHFLGSSTLPPNSSASALLYLSTAEPFDVHIGSAIDQELAQMTGSVGLAASSRLRSISEPGCPLRSQKGGAGTNRVELWLHGGAAAEIDVTSSEHCKCSPR